MKISPKPNQRAKLFACFLTSALAGVSANSQAADISGGSGGVSVWGVSGATSMRVSGPRGFSAEADSLSLNSQKGLPNGSYRYEVYGPTASADDPFDSKHDMDNGRSAADKANRVAASGVIASGHFRIVQGQVFVPGNETEE